MCRAKCCPAEGSHPVLALGAVLGAAVLGRQEWPAITAMARTVLSVAHVAALAVSAAAVAWLILAAVRFARAAPAARRNYPRVILARLRWRWLTRNLALAHADPHGRRKMRGAFGPAVGTNVRIEKPKGHVRYPRARFRADAFGVIARIKTIPKAGRAEFEKAAADIADEWRCTRVQVSQPKPGRLLVRGLVTDPLAARFGPEGAPEGTYSDPHPFRPYLGRDEWAADRWADLSGLTGITVVGLPGYGKTSLILSLLHQLAGTAAVQFVFIDGKGGGDYADWRQRAWLHSGDELPAAAAVLEDVHSLMRHRLAAIAQGTGQRNMWHSGPTPDYPLIVTVVDEAHTFYDLDAVKGTKEAESHVRACRALSGQLIKKGRSVLFLTILITQKGTSDALPTALRDNCGLGFAFATKTRDGAVAGLGESIKEYPSYCPTTLRDRSMIGVATASLPSGSDPFVRLRVPEITEAAASARAAETAHLRADPTMAPVPVSPIVRAADNTPAPMPADLVSSS